MRKFLVLAIYDVLLRRSGIARTKNFRIARILLAVPVRRGRTRTDARQAVLVDTTGQDPEVAARPPTEGQTLRDAS